jgi:predicted AlkP superfamily pyrophosphatase or phosphodiesterase
LAASVASAPPKPVPARAAEKPRLVVVVVVDQMRADYVHRYGGRWTGGLRRLLDQGAVFQQAAYPHLATVTCVGHATISTGAFPRSHGIVGNTGGTEPGPSP